MPSASGTEGVRFLEEFVCDAIVPNPPSGAAQPASAPPKAGPPAPQGANDGPTTASPLGKPGESTSETSPAS
jgi:hypothetical protein